MAKRLALSKEAWSKQAERDIYLETRKKGDTDGSMGAG